MDKLKQSAASSQEPPPSRRTQKRQSLKALDRLNLTLGDVRDVFEPYLAIFLAVDRHWDQSQVGLAIAVTNIAGIVAQTPIGAIVDGSRYKRVLIALSMLAIALSYGVIVQSMLPMVLVAQAIIGVATVTVTPAINAISLGLVGYDRLQKRIGRNEVFNRIGNAGTAVIAGGLGLAVGRSWVFGLLVALCIMSGFVVFQIRNQDIDQTQARADDQVSDGDRTTPKELLTDRRLLRFGVAVVLFYAANATLLPLVSQQLAGGQGSAPSIYVSACVVLSQLSMIPIAAWAGKSANGWGRKPLMLIAFAAVLLRALLYTVNSSPWFLVAVQALDGVASGLFSVLIVVIVADLTQGTGRFNLAQGMIQTLVGVGAALSNLAIGFLAKAAGYHTAYLTAAAIAAIGLGWYWVGVPETRKSSG